MITFRGSVTGRDDRESRQLTAAPKLANYLIATSKVEDLEFRRGKKFSGLFAVAIASMSDGFQTRWSPGRTL